MTMLALLLLLLSDLCLTLSLNQEGLFLQRVKIGLSDPGGVLSDWNSRDDTPCNWTGVTCDPATGSVVAVNLTSAGLSGPFPTFLCRLSSLSILNLHDNNISSLPLSISNCRNLTTLNLGQNLLEGPIPYTLADIPNLRDLILEGNSFSGAIPASFGRFRRLETLDLVNNLLNGTIPVSLGNISTLKSLTVGWNPFTPSRIVSELGHLSNLERLFLSGCNLFGSIPASFGRLSRLTNLDVSNNLLTGSIPSLIIELKSAVQIELFSNGFSGELPVGWSNLTALRRFDASLNRLVGTIPDELFELPLESLNLNDNQLVGLVPESIARSPNLRELKLFNNRLHGSLPSELGKHSPLEILDVSDNQFSGEIPAGVCEMGVLVELLVKNNSFSGTIPAVLGNCRTLNRVRLRANGFSGEVPKAFWSLPHVDLLDLGENLFSGNISHTISGASNLSILLISKNRFSGNIPKEIGYLGKLVEFSGSDNKFSGKIPATIVNLGQLSRLDLHNNELSGKIPVGIQSLQQLNDLNLANNRLSGEIPDEIGSFPVLNYLDLSRNYFSGKIPLGLQNLKLNVLNLSYNRLSGDIPPLYAKDMYRESFLGNPGLCGDLPGLCVGKTGARSRGYVWTYRAIFVLVGMVSGFGAVWLGWKFWNFRKMKKGMFNLKWKSFHKLGFREDEILDYLREDNVIGMGASGKVYRAVLGNGEVVAVKKLFERSRKDDGASFDDVDHGKGTFEVEVETLGKIRHKNIVRLWCCCNTRDCKLLVYEYMPNGSLGDLLHSSKGDTLDWRTRFKIALDAAEGLSYLHHGSVPPIVHRDVKSNNILLDADFGAKISDFGVAKIVRTGNKGSESMSVIAGSCGYIAPEYAHTLRVNEKSDVYSFGVVILELVTGRKPIDPELGEDLVTWVRNSLDKEGVDRVIDPHLDLVFKEQICKVLDIGILCVSHLPINRPAMPRVVKMLREAGSADNKPRRGKKDGNLSPYYYQGYSDQV